jgi:hypothetical protein
MVFHETHRYVQVSPFSDSLGILSHVPVVSAAVAYDDHNTGETILLRIHQALLIDDMETNLLCPMQMRMNDVKVDEVPKFLAENPNDQTHALCFPNEQGYTIPLSLKGVTSYFPTRKPTLDEYNNCRCIDLTYESPEWNPHSLAFERQEEAMTDSSGHMKEKQHHRFHDRRICVLETALRVNAARTGNLRDEAQRVGDQHSQCSSVLSSVSNTLNDDSFYSSLLSHVNISHTSTRRKNVIDAERLATTWNIGIEAAKQTLKATTQRGIRSVANPDIARRFRTNDRQLRYRRLRTNMFSDTYFASATSKDGNNCAQIFCDETGWMRSYPMKSKSTAHEALSLLFSQFGVPDTLVVDGSLEQVKGQFKKKAREADCHIRQTEPYSWWSNRAEGAIRELKKGVARMMLESKAPKRLWDHCAQLAAKIKSHTAGSSIVLNGQVPETHVTGSTADISEIAEYKWYQWLYYKDEIAQFPSDPFVLGRYLGPSEDVGPAMAAKIIKANGQIVVRTTFRGLTDIEIASEVEIKARDAFDDLIKVKLGDKMTVDDYKNDPDVETPFHPTYSDNETGDSPRMPDIDDYDVDSYDQYIGAEVTLPLGNRMASGKVKGRKRSHDGSIKGKAHSNPMLDSRTYTVEFADGDELEYAANIIAESMWAQSDLDGNQYLLLDSIVDHKKDKDAVEKKDRFIVSRRGTKSIKKSTRGWMLCIKWRDESTTWERLADLKESNPIEVAEYAVSRGIEDEPAFAWWVPYTLKKRTRILAAVNQRYRKKTHKFGIRMPKTVEEAHALDKQNGNDDWRNAIQKEMNDVMVAFKLLDDSETVPIGYQYVQCHMIFDVKMENFRRKARFVAGGHMTETPAAATYASVVSRESVRIALTIAALNDLDILAGDVRNAYLCAPVSELVWTTCGVEFGTNYKKTAIIVRALYGLKSAGAAFRNHLAVCMTNMGYKSCLADPDVWYRSSVRGTDNHEYYEYVLIYVDDILCMSHDPKESMRKLDKFFPMKEGSIGPPDIYLGAKLSKVKLPNNVEAWAMSPSKYVQEAVTNCEDYLEREYDGRKLERKASTPFKSLYRPELDTSPELGPEQATYFQSVIGVLRWAVEIGRVDILTEVSMLSSHLAMPREGHLEAVFHIFAYLKKRHNTRMVFDPTYPNIDLSRFKEVDWRPMYGDIKEALPHNAPEPRGKEVDIRVFVDADHAGDKITRRSRTGFIIFINNAPVIWYSKRQNTVESSVFGSEFVAMKTAVEVLRGLRYKLRMMGIRISGPTYGFGDNLSVIRNTSMPESVLRKKNNSICYHAVREAAAMGEIWTTHESGLTNPADLFTKVLPGGQRRDDIIRVVLYDI